MSVSTPSPPTGARYSVSSTSARASSSPASSSSNRSNPSRTRSGWACPGSVASSVHIPGCAAASWIESPSTSTPADQFPPLTTIHRYARGQFFADDGLGDGGRSHVRGEEQPDQGAVGTGHHYPGHIGVIHSVRQRGGILSRLHRGHTEPRHRPHLSSRGHAQNDQICAAADLPDVDLRAVHIRRTSCLRRCAAKPQRVPERRHAGTTTLLLCGSA